MALNPLIPLTRTVPDASGLFSNILLGLKQGEEKRGREEEARRIQAEAPLRNRLMEAQTQTAEANVPTKQQKFNQSQLDWIKSVAMGAKQILPDLEAEKFDRVTKTLEKRLKALNDAGIPNTSDTEASLELVKTNPKELIRQAKLAIEADRQISQQGVKQETFSQPVAGVSPQGEQVFTRFGSQGTEKPVTSIKPIQKGTAKENAKQIQQEFKNAQALRGEFTKVTQNFAAINDAFGRISASAVNPSPAGDLSLIFNYMKMLDPGSVVRESEFRVAASAGDFGDRIQVLVQKVTAGTMLSSDQRKDFTGRAKMLFKEAGRIHSNRKKEFEKLATRQGVDPENVVFERSQFLGTPGVAQTAQPQQQSDLSQFSLEELIQMRNQVQ